MTSEDNMEIFIPKTNDKKILDEFWKRVHEEYVQEQTYKKVRDEHARKSKR